MKTIKSILVLTFLILSFGCTPKIINHDPSSSVKSAPKFVKGGAKTGARSVKNITNGMMANMPKLRQLFNEEYKDYPSPQFKVTVKFNIYYLGNVTSSEIIDTLARNSKRDNSVFYSKILTIIDSTQFGPIAETNDTTWVIYPLVFSK
jgi:hypothetical protein